MSKTQSNYSIKPLHGVAEADAREIQKYQASPGPSSTGGSRVAQPIKPHMNKNRGENMQTNWKDAFKLLQRMRAGYRELENIMTAFERQTNSEEIKQRAESLHPVIAGGALAEHAAAIKKIEASRVATDRARAAEINRWKPDQLRAELENVRTLVTLAAEGRGPSFGAPADVGGRLQAIYQEAQASGDIYKQRAACEVLQSLDLAKFSHDDKPAALSVANLSKRTLKALRETPELAETYKQQDAALNDYIAVRQEIIEVSKALGEGNPEEVFTENTFSKALRQVKMNRNTGEITILPPDSPEVAGVIFKETPGAVAGE